MYKIESIEKKIKKMLDKLAKDEEIMELVKRQVDLDESMGIVTTTYDVLSILINNTIAVNRV